MPDGRHRGRGSDWFTSGRRVLRVFGPAGSLSVGSGAGWRAGKGQLGLEDLLVCLGDVIHLVEPDVALGPVRLIAVRLDPGDQVLVDHRVAEAVRDAEEFEGVALEGAGVVIWVKGGRPPAGWMWLAAMVARSASRVAKLCTGPPPGVALVAALARAAGERWAGATGYMTTNHVPWKLIIPGHNGNRPVSIRRSGGTSG
jgi:hypothetical protein